jgi:hypothetical protein
LGRSRNLGDRRIRHRHGVLGRRNRLLDGRRRLDDGGSLDGRRLVDARFPGRKERERIEVSVGLARQAHAEVDVRAGGDRVAARAEPGDDGSLLDGLTARDKDLAELQERDGVAVDRQDRDRPASARHCAREGDRAGDGRPHVGAELATDVDAAVLSAEVRVLAQDEGA